MYFVDQGGGGFRLKPQMKVSFVWMWPYRILDARAQKECSWRVHGARAPSNQLAGWLGRCASSSRRWPRVNPNNRQSSSWQHFPLRCLCGLLVTWSIWSLSALQGRRTTLSLLSLGRENCFAVTRRLLSPHQVGKLFPSRPSFLRRRTSTGFASRRFSRWQSENQKDSRLGRERIIISWRDLRATECPTDKNGESWGMRLCHVFKDRPRLHVCMRAYLRNLLGSAARCWPNHCIVQFFCSLFVNLLCRKPEIESLGFTCNWLVLGRLAGTSATCTYFRVADKFTTAKRKDGTLYQILQDTRLSFACCVGLAQLKETPAHRTAASLWLRSNLRRCTNEPTPHSVHAPPAMFIEVTSATLRAHPKQALSTARQQGRGVLEPLYTTTSASSSWSRPRNICIACLFRWHLPRRSPPFIRLGPQPTQKCWQQWQTDEPDTESKVPSSSGMVKANDDGACLRLAHAQVENEIPARPRRAPRRARVSTVDCARSPYGESTFKRNRPSFAVLMVLGGGGAQRNNWLIASDNRKTP